MSSISKTTIGGAEFELLCRGTVRNYSANPADLSGQTEVKAVKKKLIAQLEDTIKALQIESGRKIAKIYIGKTYQRFYPLKHHTWKKNGISSRWGEHKHKDYGRDGLVVLGAITRETMPERCRGRVHQEDFALAMEQKLLHHYLLSHPDPRVVNETFTTGQATKDKCHAYAIYMAFRYEGEASSSTMSQHSEPDPSPSPSLSPTPSPPPSSSSVQQIQAPDLSVQHAIPSTAARTNRRQASGRETGNRRASSSMNQGTASGAPTRGRAPATRLYREPHQPPNPGPRSTQPNETQQSTRSSNRRSVRFDENRMPQRLRRATQTRSITIDLTEE